VGFSIGRAKLLLSFFVRFVEANGSAGAAPSRMTAKKIADARGVAPRQLIVQVAVLAVESKRG
jgi:hypothetical protein